MEHKRQENNYKIREEWKTVPKRRNKNNKTYANKDETSSLGLNRQIDAMHSRRGQELIVE